MLFDGYWKKELIHNKKIIKKWRNRTGLFRDYAEHQVNKAILYSSVIIRKMFEDEKYAEKEIKKIHLEPLPEGNIQLPALDIINYKAEVIVYPFEGDKELINNHMNLENYNRRDYVIKEIELNQICNLIIHSFVWSSVFCEGEKEIYGVVFSSDKEKANFLYLMQIDTFIKIIDFCLEKGRI